MRDPLPSTLWTQVLDAGRGTPSALEALLQRYLEPVYAYVRAMGHARGDAEDLTHDFFVHVLESPLLARADPTRGSFRGFLVTCLRNFLTSRAARASALKRGGNRKTLQLDVEAVERGLVTEPGADPARQFERRYAQATVDRALARLHRELTPGASQVFTLAYGADPLPHREIAARTGLEENAVAASVSRSRKKLKQLLLAEVRETVAEPGQAEAELKALYRALGG